MTYTISKQFSFSASHVVEGLPEGHQCGRLHGHNYVVEVRLRGDQLQAPGFLRDFGELTLLREFINKNLDHRHLNDVVPGPSTSEFIAGWLLEMCRGWWPEVIAVRVSETPATWAEATCG
jgi:6-pyruvoyltetrahydropterin/6-carboxytetrahydropterin synthase